jgi:hypothetical protein
VPLGFSGVSSCVCVVSSRVFFYSGDRDPFLASESGFPQKYPRVIFTVLSKKEIFGNSR